jgi:glycosyltransferase involved in cell wall biosynthesis
MIILNHIKHLSRCHTIDLMTFKDRRHPDRLGELPRWCNRIDVVDRPPRWRVLGHMLHGIVRDPHVVVSVSRSDEMSEAINRRLSHTEYDVVLFQLLQTAQFRPSWYQAPTIWCLEDPLALKVERMRYLYAWYKRPLARMWSARLMRYEKAHASTFDRIVCVNKEDSRDYMNLLKAQNFDWVPSGIDVDYFRPSREIPREEGMIVITGNMDHPPNVDAIDYFCREIFPLIWQRVPSANLWLVGSRPVSQVKKWMSSPRVKVTGFVPDIRPYLQKAMVSVCAVRLKIGTQTKILEALACATPVVTSPAGNYGIGGVSGEQLYVAAHPAEFADRVVSLLRGEKWCDISTRGREFVVNRFSWEQSVERLEQIMEQLVPASRSSRVEQ